jgi:mannan endo-1,4-beta-mannosidase
VLSHAKLDFTSAHVYAFGAIDDPVNTIDCALAIRDAVRFAFENGRPRPFLDTEHGPIHRFLDLGRQLPPRVDNRDFHNMSWAHLATGGAGGGMRWPYRNPHRLTTGMHAVQRAMSRIVPALDWRSFAPQPIDHQLRVIMASGAVDPLESRAAGSSLPVLSFGCADRAQALIWLLRDLRVTSARGTLPPAKLFLPADLLLTGVYCATFWDTSRGVPLMCRRVKVLTSEAPLDVLVPSFTRDLAITIRQPDEDKSPTR